MLSKQPSDESIEEVFVIGGHTAYKVTLTLFSRSTVLNTTVSFSFVEMSLVFYCLNFQFYYGKINITMEYNITTEKV